MRFKEHAFLTLGGIVMSTSKLVCEMLGLFFVVHELPVLLKTNVFKSSSLELT